MGPNWTQAKKFILGVGAKMLTIARPAIVCGERTGAVYGILCWICRIQIKRLAVYIRLQAF
jgi:hypothetical protein